MNSRQKWNQKYESRLHDMGLPVPNPRLQQQSQYFTGGSALDLACGLGANSIYLAQQNYEVKAIDVSDVAIEHLKQQSIHKSLNIHPSVKDLTDKSFFHNKEKVFDFVVITYYLDRSIFSMIPSIIKDNGYFFMETFFHSPLNQQNVAAQYKLHPGELLSTFSNTNWHVLFYEENEHEGRQTILARKKHSSF
ncbi:class I SAM-dependent methyltransferase [Alkalihalobacterium sp. APHAB7]|uniref:class I SAM-dependent methyltransferase n=1 Tax=Alkalihalobacterium sp. APHAB7 TaxID=3402081 RepID=UPI003AB0B08D